jgi:6,7-dimethyl-8-ribityllumazine synthase
MSRVNGEIILVVSRFNQPVTEVLLQGAQDMLQQQGVDAAQMKVIWVPGAYEIPYAMQKHMQSKTVVGGIALGAVIRGETAHFDYVAGECSKGVMRVMLDLQKPISFGVLTTENEDQAFARADGNKGNKGSEAAEVLLEMLTI